MAQKPKRPPAPDLPIYRAEGTFTPTYEQLFAPGPAAFIQRPPELIGVPGAYACYVRRDYMSPALEPGDIIYVNTALPTRNNNLVVVYPSDASQNIMFRQLTLVTRNEVVIRQLNPTRTLTLPRSDVEAVHVIQYIRKFT